METHVQDPLTIYASAFGSDVEPFTETRTRAGVQDVYDEDNWRVSLRIEDLVRGIHDKIG